MTDSTCRGVPCAPDGSAEPRDLPEPAPGLTRRDLLRGSAAVAVAGAFPLTWALGCRRDGPGSSSAAPAASTPQPRAPASASAPAPAPGPGAGARSTVVLVRDPAVLGPGRQVNAEVLTRMLDEGVARLTGALDPLDGFRQLFRPTDTVGIKSNHWRFLGTPPELEQALQRRLLEVGVPAEQVAVDDRGVLRNPVFKAATALVNVRPARTHHWAGVGSLIKNYVMFSESPPSWHADACADLAGLWKLPAVRGLTRLNILVMLTPLFHGKGPHHYQAQYTWEYNGLLLGTDPVAVDATGLRILEAQRAAHFGSAQPLAVSPKHIALADQRHGLGVADPERIDLLRIGSMDGALI